ncbi:C-type lectin domain-containing protein [Polyangium jinanense]|uniref:C-type lectin domain-containing protein n=1 Tax=Polyangium jinanense TaxID=2829994 RepID=A0A9X3XC06_9BACT|nr:C-type lectin domain-containing protein [Polyangium jinanense]MDC3960000.1 C-type lectin domain-containing protein [Polyangium jinanense]MDC3986218.1 C-type lectin domain-containing protein [Polyangium jinanense]
MLSTTRLFRSSLRSLLLAAPLALAAAPLAGCVAEPGTEDEDFTSEDAQALATEICNGVDDDGDDRIDEDGICDCQTHVDGGHEYRVCQNQLDHATAQAMCEGRGYGLARIESLTENAFLQPFAVGTQGFWIDLNDRVVEGDYRWSNGFSASLLNWSTYEPNNAGNEDCGMMWDTGKWNDLNCAWTNKTFCELLDPVGWVDLVNATNPSGTRLARTAAGVGGARSSGNIGAGDGFVQFSPGEVSWKKAAGLGVGNTSTNRNDIEFGIYFTHDASGAPLVRVQEGAYDKGSFGTYAWDDVFRVEVVSGKVRYLRNGMPFYTSATAPTAGMVLDTSLEGAGAFLTDARVHACIAGEIGCVKPGFWDDVVYALARENNLRRVGSSVGGAISRKSIPLGSNGYVQFSTGEITTKKAAGLGAGNTSANRNDIDYGIYLTHDASGTPLIRVQEGAYDKGSFGTYAANDVFRVEVLDGKVRYLRNGVPFYTSHTAPSADLRLDTSVEDLGATITNAALETCKPGDVACIDPGMWDDVRYVYATEGELESVWGTSSVGGAISRASIPLGAEGYMQFTAIETTTKKAAGLGAGNTSELRNDIEYGIYLTHDASGAPLVRVQEAAFDKGSFGTYAAGDVFRVEVLDNEVRYLRNGVPFYTSRTAPSADLRLDTSLENIGAVIVDMEIMTCAEGDTTCIDPGLWDDVRYVFAEGNELESVSGTSSVGGAVSRQTIAMGQNGYAEFSAAEVNAKKAAGLGTVNTSENRNDIEYGIYLTHDASGAPLVRVQEGAFDKGSFGTYTVNDVFRVQVSGNTVRYLRNGTVFYTSLSPRNAALALDTSLENIGALLDGMAVVITP